MALTDNLISYWKMDEASGNALDAHSTNDLTDNNAVGSAAGKINNGRDFEATSTQNFSKASNASLQMGDIDWTVQAWVKPESFATSSQVIAKDGDGAGNREYGLYFATSGVPAMIIYRTSGGSFTQVAWGSALSAGTWYCLHGWHDSVNDLVGIAVNAGTPVTAAMAGAAVVGGAAEFNIGRRTLTSFLNYFDGVIDEVAIWKRLLTSQERTDLYNGGAGLSYDSFGGGGVSPLLSMIQHHEG